MSVPDTAETWLKYLSNDGGSANPSPDVAGGEFVQLFGTEVRETYEKNVSFIPRARGYGEHFLGPTTLALDFLQVTFKFNITAKVYAGKDGLHSLPDSMTDSNGDGQVTGEDLSFGEFDSFVLMGATGIKNGSVTVTNDTQSVGLTEGSDYEVDYDRGRIKILDTANTGLDDEYSAGYTFEGSAYNIATTIRRMSQLGGAALLETDRTEYTASSGESARNYTVQIETVEIRRQPSKPDEVEISINAREGLDRE